jgi:alpha-ribazole phosphatase CobZ
LVLNVIIFFNELKKIGRKEMEKAINRPLEDRLKERGITIEALVETGLEMYITDPEIGGRDEVGSLLRKEILSALKDINICSLIIAGIKLEDEGRQGLIPGLSEEEYQKDPVHLIADEILGIQIATYIAGTRALFEFERFDRKKPGILNKLPPILDDVIGGLISGCLVKTCSR